MSATRVTLTRHRTILDLLPLGVPLTFLPSPSPSPSNISFPLFPKEDVILRLLLERLYRPFILICLSKPGPNWHCWRIKVSTSITIIYLWQHQTPTGVNWCLMMSVSRFVFPGSSPPDLWPFHNYELLLRDQGWEEGAGQKYWGRRIVWNHLTESSKWLAFLSLFHAVVLFYKKWWPTIS